LLGHTILTFRPGVMLEAIKPRMTPEQAAQHSPPEHSGEQGNEFLLIERWENVAARMDFTLNRNKSRDKQLFP
jgi:hypothetical protein